MLKKSPTLEVFSDYIDPWCYYTLPTFQALNELGVSIRRRAFLILPKISDEGITIQEYDDSRGNTLQDRVRLDAIEEKMIYQQKLPWIKRTHMFNSRPAHILSKWSDTFAKGGEAFHREIFLANFGMKQNIAKLDVLIEICEKLGLPTEQVQTALTDEKYIQLVKDDIKMVKKMGIHEVPTYICNNRSISGYLGLEELKNFVGL